MNEQQKRDLVDALAGAIDTNRRDEVNRVVAALEPVGLGVEMRQELRLHGEPSIGRGDVVAVNYDR